MTHSNPGGRRGAPAVRPDLPDPDAPQLCRGRGETLRTRGSQRTAESTLSSPAVKRVTRPKSIRQGDRAAERRPANRAREGRAPAAVAPSHHAAAPRPGSAPQPRPPHAEGHAGGSARVSARASPSGPGAPARRPPPSGRGARRHLQRSRRDGTRLAPGPAPATRPLSRDVRDVSVSCSEASEPRGAEAASVRPPRGTGVFLGGVSLRGPADDLFPFLRF